MQFSELIAIYTQQSFILDYEQIEDKKGLSNDQSDFQDKLYDQYKENSDTMLLNLGFQKFLSVNSNYVHPSLFFIYKISRSFVEKLTTMPEIEFLRQEAIIDLNDEEASSLLSSVPFVKGTEYVNIDWIKSIWDRLSYIFSDEISKYSGTVQDYLSENDSSLYLAGRIYFHLVENKGDSEYPFAFLATYSIETKDTQNRKKVTHLPLKNALNEYKNQDDKLLQLLSTVSKAAQKSDFISDLMESGELFMPLRFTQSEAYTFLTEIPLYEEAQIRCRIPDWWRKKQNRLSVSINIGEKSESKVGFSQLVSFNPTIKIGEDTISVDELKNILQEAEGLLLIKGKWVEVNHEKLKEVLYAYENAEKMKDNGITLMDAMKMQFELSKQDPTEKESLTEVTYGAWLKEVIQKLRKPTEISNITTAESFKANLRKYQETGLNWLNYMRSLGFGACLADDMGLGKTIQIIALLENMRLEDEKQKVLLIIPASLIGNWKKELTKFAPKLPYTVLHKSDNKDINLSTDNDAFLYITTYGMTVKLEDLKNIEWDLVILDEAQAIKNPGTKQTKSVKQIPASTRIAMTGTPIENKLSDLWSLFDFINAGLLGSSKEFSTYAKNLNTDPLGYSNLRNLVNPFILRRLKTDRSIISDLPEKIEIKEYPELTKKQITLYNELVKNLKESIVNAEGIERKGLVLSSIIKMKQICNHPDQFLGQGAYKPDHSGKFVMLKDLCETIRDKRERVLVFTQFREMTNPLSDYLSEIFGRPGLVLHGGTSIKNRSELVDEFCGERYVPFMVLSLKAGGVGLNLTAANHVIHFDRWWNPAVENQATDRAFRIGQKNDVIVHKLITEGTIEEKIDLIMEEKQKLASDLISGSDENWILNMSNDELINLFTFGGIKQ